MVCQLLQNSVSRGTKFCIESFPASCQHPGMKPQTEEFLNFLLWSADKLAKPTFRNLTDSYENWAYHNGLLRRGCTLQGQAPGEGEFTAPYEPMYSLTP